MTIWEVAKKVTVDVVLSVLRAKSSHLSTDEVRNILRNTYVSSLDTETIHYVLCLRDAWNYVAESVDTTYEIDDIRVLGIILRDTLQSNNVEQEKALVDVVNYSSPEECFVRFYELGNVAHAFMLANKKMIQQNKGFLSLNEGQFPTFLKHSRRNDFKWYVRERCARMLEQPDTVVYKGQEFSVYDIIESLPSSIRQRYGSDYECAVENVGNYARSVMF